MLVERIRRRIAIGLLYTSLFEKYIHIHTYVYVHIHTHLYIHMSVEQIRRRLRTHSQTSCGEKKKLHIYIMKRELTEETVHES